MPRPTINPTDEFYDAVEKYRQKRNLKSWSQAILELAAIGYKKDTGKMPPKPYTPWGGKRDKDQPDELDIERLEVKLMGLPPLADDE